MNILIDCRPLQTYSAFRGIGRYARQIMTGFSDDSWAHFLFFNERGIFPEIDRKLFIHSPRRMITFTDHRWLIRLLKEKDMDLYHSTAYALPRRVNNMRYVITIHDLTPVRFPEYSGFRHRFIFRRVLESIERADRVITVSKNTAVDLMEITGIPEERVRVIHNSLDDRINSARAVKPSFDLPSQYMFYTGGDDPIKNIHTIVQTIPVLKIPLVIAGRFPAASRDRYRSSLPSKYREWLIFSGFVTDEELSYLYQKADVFLFPSLYEGFGYPPVEALKCGTPSVVSRKSSLPEVLGDSALYVDNPVDTREFSEKIRLVIENGELRQTLLEKGRAILNRYHPDIFKKKLLGVYSELAHE